MFSKFKFSKPFSKSSKRDCKIVKTLLWRYAAGQLSDAESAKVQRHLNACKECREQMSAYRQTVEGVSTLRALPVPASRLNWQDVQLRLAQVSPEPAALLSPALFRRMAAGAAIGGMACLLLGVALMRHRGAGETMTPDSSHLALNQPNQNQKQNTSAFLNAFPHKPGRLVAALDKEKTDKNENGDTPIATFADRGANRRRRKKADMLRGNARLAYHLRVARRKHSKLGGSSYQLAQQYAQKPPTAQIAALTTYVAVTDFHEGREREQPEYVLTTIVDSAPQPRDFVLDSMTDNAQNASSPSYNNTLSYNNSSNECGKEIRGW